MAKKRFTDDLFGLLDDATPDTASESVAVEVPVATPTARRKIGSKNFTSDLDDFLGQTMEAAAPARPRKRRRSGLDFLIRSTVSENEDLQPDGPASDRKSAETKRVTLVFNKEHLAELKAQAKDRNMYLKDVVQEMVADYLERG